MRACAICVLAVPAMAQFYGLTTTDDGSQLYLSSTLQLAGSGDTLTSAKIFRYDGTKFTLFSELPRVVTNPAQPLATQYVVETNFYNLETPRVSGNGTTMGYVGYADCVGACFYNHVIAAQTTLQFTNALLPLTLPGSCTISPKRPIRLVHAFGVKRQRRSAVAHRSLVDATGPPQLRVQQPPVEQWADPSSF